MKTRVIYAFLFAVIVIFSFAGCSDAVPETPEINAPTPGRERARLEPMEPLQDIIPVRTVEIRLEERRLERGVTFYPEVIVLPEDATDRSYTLHSSNELILRETIDGWRTFSSGTAELIATASNGTSRRLTVTVIMPVERIVLEASQMTIDVDEVRQLRYTILPRNATDRTLSFSSSDEDVATISPEGYITGLQEGRTVIEAVSEDGNVTSDIEITVVTPVTAVTVRADRIRFNVGETIPIAVTLEPDEATDAAFDLSVDNRYAEIIDNSSLRAVSAGSVTITATALNGVYGYITIEIFDLAEMTAELFRLSNEVRESHGLTVFTQNDALTAAALVRAEESAILFAHQRPDGRGPFTAFTENEVEFLRAAENLAAGQVFAQQAIDGWMNSPGHRANILNPYLLQLGVAVVLGDEGRLYWIQVFTD